jgi:hypothetical protein
MKYFFSVLLFGVSLPLIGQESAPQKSIPAPDFLLHVDVKAENPHTVLGPMKTDSHGTTTGSFAVYGGPHLFRLVACHLAPTANRLP